MALTDKARLALAAGAAAVALGLVTWSATGFFRQEPLPDDTKMMNPSQIEEHIFDLARKTNGDLASLPSTERAKLDQMTGGETEFIWGRVVQQLYQDPTKAPEKMPGLPAGSP